MTQELYWSDFRVTESHMRCFRTPKYTTPEGNLKSIFQLPKRGAALRGKEWANRALDEMVVKPKATSTEIRLSTCHKSDDKMEGK